MPTLKRIKFVRRLTTRELYARTQINELKNKIKLNKALLNEGRVNPESWRQRWLEEVRGFKFAICAWKKLLTQKRKPSGMECPFCHGEMYSYAEGFVKGLGIAKCKKCGGTVHRFKTDTQIIESQKKYFEVAI